MSGFNVRDDARRTSDTYGEFADDDYPRRCAICGTRIDSDTEIICSACEEPDECNAGYTCDRDDIDLTMKQPLESKW